MPLQNRVTPFGEIVSVSERGMFMGNRGGKIHDPATRTLSGKRWASKQWICCRTEFRERRRAVMGQSYTELFFLDEVTALSAGHRPCFECRRADALAFAATWAKAYRLPARPRAGEMDIFLHQERRISTSKPRKTIKPMEFPDGVMVEIKGTAFAIMGAYLLCWTPAGYDHRIAIKPTTTGRLLTPNSVVETLRWGYLPHWHPSAEYLLNPS